MEKGALLAFIAWQVLALALTESVREIRVDERPLSVLNMQLVIPLVMSETNHVSDVNLVGDATLVSDQSGEDTPFSSIPSSAFTLDEGLLAPSYTTKLGGKLSHEQDLAYRPRSIYLESVESDERSERGELDAELSRACSRLARVPAGGGQHQVLLLLCGELLDPPAPPACPCCAAPLRRQPAERARRDFMPIGNGENTNWKPHLLQ